MSKGASGADLFANLKEELEIQPFQRVQISTGTFISIPPHYEGMVRARSGFSFRTGLFMINGVGTIDSDYRGEIIIPYISLAQEKIIVQPQQRIAQLVICPVVQASFKQVHIDFRETERGDGGFGSTGYF